MKKVVLRIPEIDYVLIHWEENTFTPWVAAWCYYEDGTWGQGHYFCKKETALEYLAEMLRERGPAYLETRVRSILTA